MKIERIRPEEIERRSFEIITDLLGEQQPPDETAHHCKAGYPYNGRSGICRNSLLQ